MNVPLDYGVSSRRTFLKGMAGILAAGVAPAAIGSSILMPVRQLWTPDITILKVPAIKASYCVGWSISNKSEAPVVLRGFNLGDLYVGHEGIVLQPGQIIEYKADSGSVVVRTRL